MGAMIQQAIFRQLHRREPEANASAKGYTLLQLIILVAVIGIVSVAALPPYLKVRNENKARAAIGEALSLARKCAEFNETKAGAPPNPPALRRVSNPVPCRSALGGTWIASWTAGPAGMRCLENRSVATDSRATITVDANGTIACKFR